MHVCTYRIDLTKSLEAIWNGFKGSVRTEIRKAEKANITVSTVEAEEGLKRFYALYSTLAEQGKVLLPDYRFFLEIWNRLHDKGRIMLLSASNGGEPAAAIFLFLYRGRAELMWSANTSSGAHIGANHFIQWKAIERLKADGYSVYDLGGVPPDKDELPGIQFFKKSFGGDHVRLLGEYVLPGNMLLYKIWERFGKLYMGRRKRRATSENMAGARS